MPESVIDDGASQSGAQVWVSTVGLKGFSSLANKGRLENWLIGDIAPDKQQPYVDAECNPHPV
jgi:hypothetical protein